MYNKLRGRIKEFGLSESELAREIGLVPTSLNFRLTDKTPWNINDIRKIVKRLEIPKDEISIYFNI